MLKNSQKLAILTIGCCHSNSVWCNPVTKKEILGVLLIFTINALNINPRSNQGLFQTSCFCRAKLKISLTRQWGDNSTAVVSNVEFNSVVPNSK